MSDVLELLLLLAEREAKTWQDTVEAIKLELQARQREKANQPPQPQPQTQASPLQQAKQKEQQTQPSSPKQDNREEVAKVQELDKLEWKEGKKTGSFVIAQKGEGEMEVPKWIVDILQTTGKDFVFHGYTYRLSTAPASDKYPATKFLWRYHIKENESQK